MNRYDVGHFFLNAAFRLQPRDRVHVKLNAKTSVSLSRRNEYQLEFSDFFD
jgi:hypothetical protein